MKKYMDKVQVKDVRKQASGRWTWELVEGREVNCYATNKAGNGIFEKDENGFYTQQTVGTCDFKACKTVSGMRRKLKNWFCAYVA